MRTFVLASIAVVAIPCAVVAQTPAPAPPVPPQYKLQVSSHAYMPDGSSATAAGEGWTLQFGQPLRLSVMSGQTACEVASPQPIDGGKDVQSLQLRQYLVSLDKKGYTADHPEVRYLKSKIALRGNGWQLELIPVREQNGALVLTVTSNRLGAAGPAWSGSIRQSVTLTLKPGARLVLDRVPVSPVPGCDAIGVGLEIGLKPATESTLVETEVWLVQRQSDGSERSEKQVLRTRLGEAVSYYFPRAFGDMNVSGAVVPKTTKDSKVQLSLTIAREAPDASADWAFKAASATYPLSVAPDDVPSFPLSATRTNQTGTPFSLRLRTRVLR